MGAASLSLFNVETSHAVAVPAAVGIDPTRVDALVERARREVDDGLYPASQIALAKDGKLVAFETFGDATDDTRFAIFSSTKAFVCSAFWMLLGEGHVSLSDRVADLVPGFGENGKDVITIEQVLSHNAGFPTAFLNPYIWDDVERRRNTFAAWELEWEPGTRFQYHALSGHWVLCDVIETITAAHFRDVVRTRVIEPLGLRSFVLGGRDASEPIAELRIVGEPATAEEVRAEQGDLPLDPPQHHHLLALADPSLREVGIPAGGGVSTAADIAMFYQELIGNERGLWHEETLRDATGVVRNAHDDVTRGFPMNYALGVRIGGDDGHGPERGLADAPRAFGHDGAGGQIAWAEPDSGLSFCYLTNGLDDNLLRQRRRFVEVTRAAQACASSASS
jgi:CubicO group peptidase (beta-lactamase class C family)